MPEHFKRAFFAFPQEPQELRSSITAATALLESSTDKVSIKIWPQMETFGASIPAELRKEISEADVLICDVTRPNLNVYYEAGFAIGAGKAIAPVLNSSFEGASANAQRDGFFDNIGYKSYDKQRRSG